MISSWIVSGGIILVGARHHVHEHYEHGGFILRIGDYSPPVSHFIETGYIARSRIRRQTCGIDESSIGSEHVHPPAHPGYSAQNIAAPMNESGGSRSDYLTQQEKEPLRARETAHRDEKLLPIEIEQSVIDAGNGDNVPSRFTHGLMGSSNEVTEYEGDLVDEPAESLTDLGNESGPSDSMGEAL